MRTAHGFEEWTHVYTGVKIADGAPEQFGVEVDHGTLYENDSQQDTLR